MAILRLAEIIAALSQTTHLGMGQLPEPAIRSSLVATSLTRLAGIEERVLARLTHGSLSTGATAGGTRARLQRDRGGTLDLPEDNRPRRSTHLHESWSLQARWRCPVRDGAGHCPRGTFDNRYGVNTRCGGPADLSLWSRANSAWSYPERTYHGHASTSQRRYRA